MQISSQLRKINIFNLTFLKKKKQPGKTTVDNESIWNFLVKEANSVLGMMHYLLGDFEQVK